MHEIETAAEAELEHPAAQPGAGPGTRLTEGVAAQGHVVDPGYDVLAPPGHLRTVARLAAGLVPQRFDGGA